MSELRKPNLESSSKGPEAPKIDRSAEAEKLKAKAESAAEKAQGNEKKARQEVQKAVESKEKKAVQQHEKAPNKSERKNSRRPQNVTKKAKEETYKSTLKNVQSKMSSPAKTFSQIIHNPVVDKVSETAGKTIARPSGIIGGSLAVIIGLAIAYYSAQSAGFELSGSEFILLLAGGFLIGVFIEIVFKSFFSSKKRN